MSYWVQVLPINGHQALVSGVLLNRSSKAGAFHEYVQRSSFALVYVDSTSILLLGLR